MVFGRIVGRPEGFPGRLEEVICVFSSSFWWLPEAVDSFD